MSDEHQIMSKSDINRVLTRMAHQIVERHKGVSSLVFVGLHTRGFPIASRLSNAILEFEGESVPVVPLDISLYRDDVTDRDSDRVRLTRFPVDIDGRSIVIIDDVLFTGRSVRASLDAIANCGRAGRTSLAVLVDRGHRELPIRADYVGKNVPTSRGEKVKVRLTEIDGLDEAVIVRRSK